MINNFYNFFLLFMFSVSLNALKAQQGPLLKQQVEEFKAAIKNNNWQAITAIHAKNPTILHNATASVGTLQEKQGIIKAYTQCAIHATCPNPSNSK